MPCPFLTYNALLWAYYCDLNAFIMRKNGNFALSVSKYANL